jgi:hypothetical protein
MVVEVEVIEDQVLAVSVDGKFSVVEVVRDGGSLNNVQWGYGLPSDAPVGTIYVDVS